MLIASHIAMWMVVVAQLCAIVLLIHQVADLKASSAVNFDPIPKGAKAPTFTARDLHSDAVVTSGNLLAQPIVLCFLSSDCNDCRRIATDLGRYAADDLAHVAVYCHGDQDDAHNLAALLPRGIRVLMKAATEVADRFELAAFPAAVLVKHGRIVRYEYPDHARDIVAYSERIRRDEIEPAPSDVQLETLPRLTTERR